MNDLSLGGWGGAQLHKQINIVRNDKDLIKVINSERLELTGRWIMNVWIFWEGDTVRKVSDRHKSAKMIVI